MKKLLAMLAPVAFVLSLLVPVAGVSATSVCPAGFTGPDSKNMCKSVKEVTCHIENNTTAVIDNDNTQVAISGNAKNSDNTSGGSASSGSATNSNNVTFNVTVKNNNQCFATAVTPAANQGQGQAAAPSGAGAVTAPSQVAPSMLPNTGSDVVTSYLTFVAETLGIGVVSACIAAILYRRFQS